MTTTPTLWGAEVTFNFDSFAFSSRVTALQDGTFILAWDSSFFNPSDIFARHLNEYGSFDGGNFLSTVSANDPKAISRPFIVQEANGQVIVNYNQLFAAGDGDIFWHPVNSDYSPGSFTDQVEETGFDEFLLESVAWSSGVPGDFGTAIAFNVPINGAPGSHLVLRFVAQNGLPASNQIFVGAHAGETQQNAALAGRHTGHVVVAYENFNFATSQRDIRLHSYTSGELDTSGEVQVSATDKNAAFPDVVALRGGNFVVAWQQNDGIAFRRYFAEATPLDASPIVIPNSSGFLPKIAALNDGGFIIAWGAVDGTEGDGSPELDLFMQRFSNGGVAIGNRVHIDKPGDQGLDFNIATLADGRVVLTYTSETGNATNVNTLNYQIFDPREQAILGTNGADTIVGREDGSVITGFDGDDRLSGRNAADSLNGDAGADVLRGSGGDDDLNGGAGSDTANWSDAIGAIVFALDASGGGTTANVAGIGIDTLTGIENLIGGSGNDSLAGNAGVNMLEGRFGNDTLNGGLGADQMKGGFGNDTFFVNISTDATIEEAGAGTDTVRSSVSRVLSANIERLALLPGALNGTGNDLSNYIYGNAAANILNGLAGADRLIGDAGNDTYIVDSIGDLVFETIAGAAGGTDTVQSRVNHTLSANVENLTITGSAVANGTGNTAANVIIGNSAANVLDGKLGSDTMTGAAGNDQFQFSTALGASNIDRITDFSAPNDTIRLENAIFTGLPAGVLNPAAFRIGAAAADATDRIVYNSATGALLFDADGIGGAAARQFAILGTGLALTNADFVVF